MVQWLRLHASNRGDADSIPDRETKIPHAVQLQKQIKTLKKKSLKNKILKIKYNGKPMESFLQ